jgi:hypothetical protein
MNVEIGAEAAVFPEKEYIKGIYKRNCRCSVVIRKALSYVSNCYCVLVLVILF